MQKLVQDGLQGGVYELTEPANGRLSQWNARAVMVDKSENPKPSDDPLMMFDYSRVHEDLPGSFMELSSRVHDHLSNPNHRCLFAADLKHAYLTIQLYLVIQKKVARVLFESGQRMAEYDDGSDKVRSQESFCYHTLSYVAGRIR